MQDFQCFKEPLSLGASSDHALKSSHVQERHLFLYIIEGLVKQYSPSILAYFIT